MCMKNCTINLRQLIPDECWRRKKQRLCFIGSRVQLLLHRKNKCLLCKQIIFKLFHQKASTTLIAFQRFSLLFTSNFSCCVSHPPIPIESVPLLYSKAEVKKCTLTISIYAKHIIALYMITIFRNLSSKLCH